MTNRIQNFQQLNKNVRKNFYCFWLPNGGRRAAGPENDGKLNMEPSAAL